jgi:hypothetical protein
MGVLWPHWCGQHKDKHGLSLPGPSFSTSQGPQIPVPQHCFHTQPQCLPSEQPCVCLSFGNCDTTSCVSALVCENRSPARATKTAVPGPPLPPIPSALRWHLLSQHWLWKVARGAGTVSARTACKLHRTMPPSRWPQILNPHPQVPDVPPPASDGLPVVTCTPDSPSSSQQPEESAENGI